MRHDSLKWFTPIACALSLALSAASCRKRTVASIKDFAEQLDESHYVKCSNVSLARGANIASFSAGCEFPDIERQRVHILNGSKPVAIDFDVSTNNDFQTVRMMRPSRNLRRYGDFAFKKDSEFTEALKKYQINPTQVTKIKIRHVYLAVGTPVYRDTQATELITVLSKNGKPVYPENTTDSLQVVVKTEAEYLGCFTVVDGASSPTRAALDAFLQSTRLCIDKEQDEQKRVTYSFKFFDEDGNITQSFHMSSATEAPRCLHCYAFESPEGTIHWNGMLATQRPELNLNIKTHEATVSFVIDLGDTPIDNE